MDFIIRSFLLITMLAWGAGTQVMADPGESADNPLVLEAGQTYEVSKALKYNSLYATFTATGDGILTLTYTQQDDLSLYTDATYATLAETQPVWNGEYTNKMYELDVKSGVTYYFHRSFCMSVGTIKVDFGTSSSLEFVSSFPVENGRLQAGDNVDMEFNKPVAYTKVTMTVGSTVKDVTGYVRASGVHLYIDAKESMMELYHDGILKEGGAMVFAVEGLSSNSGTKAGQGEDGKVSLTLVAAAKPIELVAADNVPGGTPNSLETFYSYFMSGDKNSVASFTFDGAFDQTEGNAPAATLIYGVRGEGEAEDYAEIPLPVKFSGNNTITVDFGGAVRRPADMVQGATLYETIALKIDKVKSPDGQYSYTTSAGALGSYTYQYKYKVVDYDLVTEFYPATSQSKPSSIDNVESIELLVSETGSGKMRYSGATFTYTDGGAEATMTVQVTAAPDADDPSLTVMTIPVPAFTADANTNVVVALADVETPDGVDHSKDLTATYTTAGRTLDGIDTVVSANGGKADVYSASGTMVLKGASAADVKALQKGLYIVGDKKIVVR